MKQPYDLPEVVDKDPEEIKSIIEAIKTSQLPDDVKAFVIKCVELALWLPIFLQRKAISIHRLRTMIFGKGYNKKDNHDKITTDPVDTNSSVEPTAPSHQGTTDGAAADAQMEVGLDDKNNDADMFSTTTTDITAVVISPKDPTTNDNQESASNKKQGHGRNPHTAYTSAIDIRLLLNLTVGDECPLL